MRVVYTIIYLAIALLVIAFAVLNSNNVTLVYYLGEKTMPLSLALVISLVFGSLLGVLSCLKIIIKQKCTIRHLNHKIKLIDKEVSNLRAIPIKDQH